MEERPFIHHRRKFRAHVGRGPVIALVLVALAASTASRDSPAEGASPTDGSELVGTVAPEWTVTDWIGAPPRSLASLRGKVVLVRWFTDTDCPYCTATAPALNQLHRDFADRGLVVVGMYHHKRSQPLTMAAVRGWTHDYGFQFPVAVDRDWRTLKRWWLNGPRREFTSVTFLIDRGGVIRRIHPGGSLAPGGVEYGAMRGRIEELLAEDGHRERH